MGGLVVGSDVEEANEPSVCAHRSESVFPSSGDVSERSRGPFARAVSGPI
ncbi:hypothetical protein AKJ09_08980 [Labilithrix luteola]|uniref:Uncharacterized protein n=1 Tax=Labilithrix luteola TaxID=1391654 RepID=A0A0K1Q9I1_9BACT|nr:hypothetical protein AKJ09_08980 [Labilithrix luteola]